MCWVVSESVFALAVRPLHAWTRWRQTQRNQAIKELHSRICSYTLHRNPAYFSDPERFDPDRWTRENEAKIPRYAYLPFGARPHVCIGNHFAMMEAHLILATLIQRVTFELVPGQQIAPEPLLSRQDLKPFVTHPVTIDIYTPAVADTMRGALIRR